MDLLTSRDKLTGPKYNACVMTQYGQKHTEAHGLEQQGDTQAWQHHQTIIQKRRT